MITLVNTHNTPEHFEQTCDEMVMRARAAFFADEFKRADAIAAGVTMEQLWHQDGKDWMEQHWKE